MDLAFTDEQNILRDMVRSLCENVSSTDKVREVENDPIGYSKELWDQLKETGLLAMLLPEEYGGMGLNMIDCAVIFQELGRGLVAAPIFDSAVMAVSALKHGGSDAQKTELLEAIGSGELIVSTAWLEPDNGFGPEGVQLKAELADGNYTINGSKRHVFYAKAANKLLVLVRTGDAATDIDLILVDTDTAGVELEQQLSMASDTQYKVTFNNVQVAEANRIGAAQDGWAIWEECLDEGLILQAAYAVGGADKALEITVAYSKEREQFDKPIGSFQSLSHYMADSCTEIEGAKTLVLEAAWAHSEGRSVKRLAPMAKLFACNVYVKATRIGEQIHGGYGFTLEYDIQLYFRRAKQQQLNWLDGRALEELIAFQVLDSGERTIPDMFLAEAK